jgi:site-specific recombinase XerD
MPPRLSGKPTASAATRRPHSTAKVTRMNKPIPGKRGGKPPQPAQARDTPLRRKLHLGHFAFMRALAQGVDTRASWDRYLRAEGDYSDIRTVRRTIAWLRDEFAVAARRHDRHGTARLVRLDVRMAADHGAVLPSLQEFAAERHLEGFSEAEQMEQYRHAFDQPRAVPRASRRTRLIERQLAALRWLENLVAEPPRADDALTAWLHPDLAIRLEAAGLRTVRQLVERINGLGLRWWRGIAAIGEAKAERITAWLRAHEDTLGVSIRPHARIRRSALAARDLQQVVAPATAIVPFEKFTVPAELNGAGGAHRLPRPLCLIDADDDREAILAWVRAKRGGAAEEARADSGPAAGAPGWLRTLSHTQRAYLKEGERFLLWAVVQRNKPISSITPEDCIAYRDFLADPQPRDAWCGPRSRERWSPLWRPFEGPLSPGARTRAIAILKSLYQFLASQCYLRGNPWAAVPTPRAARAKIDVERSFTPGQWQFILRRLAQLPPTSANHRLRFAVRLLYASGLRLSEATAARVRDLRWETYSAGSDDAQSFAGWELTARGKGGKERRVPLPPELVKELTAYLGARGLPGDLHAASIQDAFLLGRASDVKQRAPWSPAARQDADPKAGISMSLLHNQLKAFFADCARELQHADASGAARLANASAHWLRHTHGSHSLAAGIDPALVQENLGHAALATTMLYAASEQRRRMRRAGGESDR